ncbi:extra-cytoplasmic solute receptor (plasmid) [Cupriavidus necator N-1]|uniref:Extra-cytoplasmic solute receptor n=2 Tax=Cupriavidus necator TaxID=106590 RepID=F8GYR1_CUPNN|nr:extra-cytoplasmic solute receptor [Cupriavidus necator N-1]
MTMSIGKLLAAPVACLVLAPMAHADPYPSKPIRLIVPFPAGGGTDTVARMMAERLQQSLKQTVVVENRAGAGGTIGTSYAAQAEPDGYTIVLGISATMVMAPFLYPNAAYTANQRFAALGQIGTVSNMLVVNPAFPAHNLKELVAAAKARPGQINYGSWGLGSGGHLCAEILMRAKGITMTHVPYKGTAPELADVLGGTIMVAMVDSTTSAPYVQAGKLRALAACTERSSNLPDVPGLKDEGVSFDSSFWYGLFAPAGTPAPVLSRLREEVGQILKQPAVAARLKDLGIQATNLSPAQFEEVVRRDYAGWGKLIREAGIKAE